MSRNIVLGITLLVASAVLAAFVPPLTTLLVILGVLALVFLARNLDFGLIILVFFFPYLGLVIDFGAFRAFREVYYLRNINAPFIDLYGLLLLGAWLLAFVARPHFFKGLATNIRRLPHFKSYLLFWLSGIGSLFMVSSRFLGTSAKYFLRPFSFFYPVFFAVPVSILTKSTSYILRPTYLHRVLLVFYATGLLSAFNGLLGLLFGTHGEFPRATPFGFFGVNPLGSNHNLLAETLIATAPAGILLGIMNYELRIKKLIWGGMWFQWLIALLTFARTAWIAVGIQALVYVIYKITKLRDKKLRISQFRNFAISQFKRALPLLLLLVVGMGLLFATAFTETVQGSTLSRLDQTRISVFYFLRSPYLGQGIGTFIPTLWQTRAFLLEYGDPLEAHGIPLKLAFEQGLAGLITFTIFVGSIFVSLIKAYRKTLRVEVLAALMIAAGSITYQLFNTTYYTSKLWIPLAIAVAITHINMRKE